LIQITPRCFAARDYGLEKEILFLFDKRYQVDVVVARDDENALPGVFRLVRVSQDVQQSASLDRNNNVLERNSALRLDGVVLLR
jgi:hypothetical protein